MFPMAVRAGDKGAGVGDSPARSLDVQRRRRLRSAASCPGISATCAPPFALQLPRCPAERSPACRSGPSSRAKADEALCVQGLSARRSGGVQPHPVTRHASARRCFSARDRHVRGSAPVIHALDAQIDTPRASSRPLPAQKLNSRFPLRPTFRDDWRLQSVGVAAVPMTTRPAALTKAQSYDDAIVSAHVTTILNKIQIGFSVLLSDDNCVSSAHVLCYRATLRATFSLQVIAALPENDSREQIIHSLTSLVPPAPGYLYRFVSGCGGPQGDLGVTECGISWGSDVIALVPCSMLRIRLAHIQLQFAGLLSDGLLETWLSRKPSAQVATLFLGLADLLDLVQDKTVKLGSGAGAPILFAHTWSHRQLLESMANFDPDKVDSGAAAISMLGCLLSDLHLAPAAMEVSATLRAVVDTWAPAVVCVLGEE